MEAQRANSNTFATEFTSDQKKSLDIFEESLVYHDIIFFEKLEFLKLEMANFGIKKGWYKCPQCARKWTSNVVRTGHQPGIMQKECIGCGAMVGPYRLVSLSKKE